MAGLLTETNTLLTGKEEKLAYQRRWRKANPEKVREASKKQYYAHRKDRIARATKWGR